MAAMKLAVRVPPFIVISLINAGVFFLSSVNLASTLRYQLLYAVLFGLLFLIFLAEREHKLPDQIENVMYLITFFVLLLVGMTGTFDSPFIFAVYFLVIMQSFYFPALVSIGQVFFLLVGILAFNVYIDSEDFLSMVSLLALVPISIYVREHYMQYKEMTKKILILENKHLSRDDPVESVLHNTIHNFAARLREYLSTMKFIALRIPGYKSAEKQAFVQKELVMQAEQALKLLKDFEEEATGAALISNPAPSTDEKQVSRE